MSKKKHVIIYETDVFGMENCRDFIKLPKLNGIVSFFCLHNTKMLQCKVSVLHNHLQLFLNYAVCKSVDSYCLITAAR